VSIARISHRRFDVCMSKKVTSRYQRCIGLKKVQQDATRFLDHQPRLWYILTMRFHPAHRINRAERVSGKDRALSMPMPIRFGLSASTSLHQSKRVDIVRKEPNSEPFASSMFSGDGWPDSCSGITLKCEIKPWPFQ